MSKNVGIGIGIIVLVAAGYFAFAGMKSKEAEKAPVDGTPQQMTISGTFECLPHANPNGPQTMECAFGLKSDAGDHYAVNLGESADSMNAFQSGAHVTMTGFFVPKEALSSDQWQKYNMKGIFTPTAPASTTATSTSNGTPAPGKGLKINVEVVCKEALAYMTFPDAKSADAFVKECIEGKHPEVIDHYKEGINADGKAI